MRIVYFLPDVNGGVARVVKNLLQYRPLNTGVQYAVVLFSCDADVANPVTDSFNNCGLIRFQYGVNENAFSIFKRLSRVLESVDDIIVGNDGLEIKMVAALKLTNPVVYILHGDFDYYYSVARLYQPVINRFIAISNFIEQQLHSRLNKALHPEITKAYFPSAAVLKRETVFQERAADVLKVIFAGELNSRKGAGILFDIYSKLAAKKVQNTCWEIIGDGELLPMLTGQFKNVPGVIFSGRQTNEYVLQQMAAADIFIFPSIAEGMPNVLIEALSVGAVPVVSDLKSGIDDIITNNLNGILVQPGDAAGFADAIETLYNDRRLLHLLQSNAGTHLDKFEPVKQAAFYEQLIINSAAGYKPNERKFPAYKRGRFLDRAWLPGKLVELLRIVFKNPKL